MRIIFPYLHEAHAVAIAALTKHAPAPVEMRLMKTDTSYFEQLAEFWARREAFVVIEHDIIIRSGAVEELQACPNAWCGFVYWTGAGFNPALGCTIFSAELIEAAGDVFSRIDDRTWQHLDIRLFREIETATGLAICAHYPALPHLKYSQPYQVASTRPQPATHTCWKGHHCRCILGENEHPGPAMSGPGGVSGVVCHAPPLEVPV